MPRDLDDEEPKLAVPDLELDFPAPARAPASAPKTATPAAPSAPTAAGGPTAGRSLGGGWDDDDELAPLPGLEVESPARAPAEPSAAPQAPTSKRGGEGGADAAKAPLEVDPYEVKVLAAFGPPPANPLASVPYAIRVVMRRRELRTALAGVRASLEAAEARVLDRLADLGGLVRPAAESDPAFAALLKPLVSAMSVKQSRESAAADADAQFRAKVAELDAALAALTAPIERAQAEAAARGKAADEASGLQKKHEARRKRVDIEVRSAQQRLASAETSATDRASAQAVIAQADGERAARAAEEQQATLLAQQAEAQAAQARKAVAELTAKSDALREQRRRAEAEFSRAGQVRGEGIGAADRELRVALIDLGRRVKDRPIGGEPESAPMRRRDVVDAEAQVRKLQHELEKHLRALEVADERSVRMGLVILGVAVTAFLTAFVLWRMLRTNPYMTPAK
jgi:hypothetical protein